MKSHQLLYQYKVGEQPLLRVLNASTMSAAGMSAASNAFGQIVFAPKLAVSRT